jgi:mannose-6-phosphate isomerase-like protein (cupin superfamily)
MSRQNFNQGSYLVVLLLSVSLLVTTSVLGQKTKADSVTFYSHSQIDSLLSGKVPTDGAPSVLLERSKDNERYLVLIRTKPGDVEVHELYDDVAIIRSGHGILKTGRTVQGHKESGKEPAREWHGGVIQNAIERSLSPGDFIVIPAMLAHQYIPNAGDKLTYWTIKVKRTK